MYCVGAAQRPAEKTPLTQSPAENTLLPPDKKKFEQNVSEISSLIRDLESQRVSFCMHIM